MPKKIVRSLENIRYGVEIECEYPDSKDSSKLIEKHRVIRGWEITFDGSLDNGSEYKAKKGNKLYYNEDGIDQIKEIIGLIKAHRGHIKKTCGSHVHICMSKFSNQEIVNIIKAFIKKQDYIYHKFEVLKCRQKDHARKIPKDVLKLLTAEIVKKTKKNEYGDNEIHEYFGNRDYGLNMLSLARHGTLEFRIFSGSIQIRTWKKYIQFAINFCLDNCRGKQ